MSKVDRATLHRAEAEVTRLQILLKRYAELVTVNAISKQEYNNTEAEYQKAKARCYSNGSDTFTSTT
nr:hypothetical protein GPGIFMOB_00340 [Acinetobacter gerneri]